MFSDDYLIELTFSFFLYCFWLFLISWTTVKRIKDNIMSSITYSPSIALWSFSFIDLKPPSSSSFNPSFVDCWIVCIIFIRSVYIDTETCTQVWLKIFNWPYKNQTYGFGYPAAWWKVVARVSVFLLHLSQ